MYASNRATIHCIRLTSTHNTQYSIYTKDIIYYCYKYTIRIGILELSEYSRINILQDTRINTIESVFLFRDIMPDIITTTYICTSELNPNNIVFI